MVNFISNEIPSDKIIANSSSPPGVGGGCSRVRPCGLTTRCGRTGSLRSAVGGAASHSTASTHLRRPSRPGEAFVGPRPRQLHWALPVQRFSGLTTRLCASTGPADPPQPALYLARSSGITTGLTDPRSSQRSLAGPPPTAVALASIRSRRRGPAHRLAH